MMIKKVRNQENVVIVFFVVTLVCVGIFAFYEKSIIDFGYFLLMSWFFLRFLKIKYNGGR